MSSSAQYASTPKTGSAAISTANTGRDGTGTLGVVYTAGPNGARIDKINTQATGTTTAGMVRYFLTRGRPGVAVTSIAFSTTTATVTTSVAHGLTTGDLITYQAALPDQYNVTSVAVTVLTATTFSYTMLAAPTVAATTVGYYSTTPATPVSALVREVPVSAVTPSATVPAFSSTASSTATLDQGYLPLILSPGWSLRAATNNAESFVCFASTSGDF